MNLKKLQDKSILLFGKSRAFSMDEFGSQLKSHNIRVVNEFCEDVMVVVEGKMMTPYEQKDSEKLYERYSKELEFISIDSFEKELAKYIDTDTLLMSLKLSHDKDRLKSFLQNSTISDELFFKLLKMYSWSKEDFFENDDNRDVSAALILRFYQNIERNHNVQYATSGLMHLIVQTNREELIEAISELEPLQKSFDSDKKSANYNILSSIAIHVNAPKNVLKSFIKKSDSYIKTLIAMRQNCDEDMQNILYDDMHEDVHEALSYNFNLSKSVIDKFLEADRSVKNIAKHVKLNNELFELLIKKQHSALALNESLTFEMQTRLHSLNKQEVMLHLAINSNLDERLVGKLLSEDSDDIRFAVYENPATPKENLEEAYKDEKNHLYLANNENTPSHILKALSKSLDIEVLKALAKNKSTPIEILYQFQLDSRLAREVKENPSFGKHIQQENIGWEV
ncbi:MAG: hypothetical protein A2513_10115 [Sulfurimonas sp. RIFOXYD12_FULL_33_39]|uniref:hypothetical protein n=1 Tax=unclassified Sulfurimonas TaxID=2623549 RepID=UPI0008AB0E81|nr:MULTISPECIES: hypothetical protein [unclassified Sulfurimonas]OHE00919.1 MAG: hypothetical protein A3G74_04250 [Sulfurimonas sp. RIFCSPLOWO2_12_FULL_34_6]OHE09667.1 MAG: hypothetical protein A2513_10115 [Sulfurimonas sp. RIFOXYD12_FULL_33_39]OHE13825.1 MAG: hypothetical protein A2530_09640 [Sulfurimonas sp. RIFOXYD2_FULL_34_21]